ncbi:hypothetical protein OsJ_31191 [Oryza sativa Japonica Group]|uniref:Myb-like domain-containing protein n=1 Tax=Oryza sativa subsp. japonica TaxID=39947 RepID=A3C3W1_ORYSJ|nr:hypothetical protein OsJ_31191 [Oryza sativa Japonica Group]
MRVGKAKRRLDLSTRRGTDEGGRTNCWKTATSAPSLARATAVRVLATDPDPSGVACVRCDVNGERVRAWSCGAKTCGMGAGRKLKTHRRNQRWADKAYKKSHFGNEWKKPFAGSSHAKGIVLEKIGIEAKQPNSAICKCARVQLVKNGKKIAAFVPNDGCLNFIKENVAPPPRPRDVYNGPFTARDDDELLRLHYRLGDRWKEIGRAVYGRTSRVMKHRWRELRRGGFLAAAARKELAALDMADDMVETSEVEEPADQSLPSLELQRSTLADTLASSFGSCSLATDHVMDPLAGSLALGFACMAV